MSKFTKGQYQTPVSIGSVINTKEREGNPFISPKEDYIIYASPNPSNPDQSDLVVSFRIKDNWTAPVSLGERINSDISEFCPFVHQKEDRLYFCRLQRTPERMNENAFYIDNFKDLLAKTRKSISK